MRVLEVRNVTEALPRALKLLDEEGTRRYSRNGLVMIGPSVATVYTHPWEKVMFHPDRDYNIAFTIYEALWILAGRRDIKPLTRYVSTFGQYSDDGATQHAAYGHRLRVAFGQDQLAIIARRLRQNPDDRRCVAQIWDTTLDLDRDGVDLPCNDAITFQRHHATGALDMTVFCRSNDMIFGAYFANAFHFGMLLEYMAAYIGCPVGRYVQISINWHSYVSTLDQVKNIRPDRLGYVDNPYVDGRVHHVPLTGNVDKLVAALLADADTGFLSGGHGPDEPWAQAAYQVLQAHERWRTGTGEERYTSALDVLDDSHVDWIVAAREWLQRRYAAWKMKQVLAGNVSHL